MGSGVHSALGITANLVIISGRDLGPTSFEVLGWLLAISLTALGVTA